jgi:hypothetical protein
LATGRFAQFNQLWGQTGAESATTDEGEEDDEPIEEPVWNGRRPVTARVTKKGQPPWRVAAGARDDDEIGDDNVGKLISLEILKELKKLKSKKGRGSDSESDSDESDDDRREKSSSRGFGALHALQKKYKRKPNKVFKDYEEMVRETLGVTSDRQFWHHPDYSRRLNVMFGRMKGMYRVHFNLSEILEISKEDDMPKVRMMLVQLLKSIHQVGLDNGDWGTAKLMVMGTDPMSRQLFGGSEKELEKVHLYQKSVRELRAQHVQSQAVNRPGRVVEEVDEGAEEIAEGEGAADGKKKNAWRKKN